MDGESPQENLSGELEDLIASGIENSVPETCVEPDEFKKPVVNKKSKKKRGCF
jgi:hypothetical protein